MNEKANIQIESEIACVDISPLSLAHEAGVGPNIHQRTNSSGLDLHTITSHVAAVGTWKMQVGPRFNDFVTSISVIHACHEGFVQSEG